MVLEDSPWTSSCLVDGFLQSALCTAAACCSLTSGQGEWPPATQVPPQTRGAHLLGEQNKGKTLARHQSRVCPSDRCLAPVPKKLHFCFDRVPKPVWKSRLVMVWRLKKLEHFFQHRNTKCLAEVNAMMDRSFCGVPSHRTVRHWLYLQILWICKNATGKNPSLVVHLQHLLLRSFINLGFTVFLINFWIAE